MIAKDQFAIARAQSLIERLKKWNSRGYYVLLPNDGVVLVFNNTTFSKEVRYYIPNSFEQKEFISFTKDDGEKKYIYNPTFLTVVKYLSELNFPW